MRGKGSINKNLNVAYLYAELDVPMLKISVECKRNMFAHQYTAIRRLILKEKNRLQNLENV